MALCLGIPALLLGIAAVWELVLAPPTAAVQKSDSSPKPEPETKTELEVNKGAATWAAYSAAWAKRYGREPGPTATKRRLCVQLVDALGADVAPEVAKYYLTMDNTGGIGHNLPFLVDNCQKIYSWMLESNQSEEPSYTENPSGAWVMAQQIIESRLTDPRSADWGSRWHGDHQRLDDTVKYLGDRRYQVSGWVRSRNKLGGVGRTVWNMVLEDNEDRWTVVSGPNLQNR
jgi:hypothetical protein